VWTALYCNGRRQSEVPPSSRRKSLPTLLQRRSPSVRHKFPFILQRYFNSMMRQMPVFKEENEIISRRGIYCRCYFAAAIVMPWLVYMRRGK
jgi:hypothetical protein